MEHVQEPMLLGGEHTRRRFALGQPALRCLQAVLALTAVVQVCRGRGKPGFWIALALLIPLLRCACRATYRRRIHGAMRRLWTRIETFAADHVSLPYRATCLLVVLPAGLFFLAQTRPVRSGDTKPVMLTASTLIAEGRSDLQGYVSLYAAGNHYNSPGELPYFFTRTAHGVHSAYPSGMAVFALPTAMLARLLGADVHNVAVLDRLEKVAASLLGAACLGLFFLLALHLVDARSATVMTLLLAAGSGLCSTVAQALWQHGGVIFWMLLALLIEFRSRRQPSRAGALLEGIALAMMFACRLASAVLILPFGLWLMCRAPRRALLVGLAALAAYVPWACYYQAIYGSVLGPSLHQSLGLAWRGRETLVPLLLSPSHGLLVYQPWILLGLAACLPAMRRAGAAASDVPAGWRWFCAAAIGLHLMLLASWNCWWGGDCWGSRLATETVPLFALLCLRPLEGLLQRRWGRSLVLATAIAAGFVNLSGVYLKADYRDHLPGLFSHRLEPPASWQNLPFLTPFVHARP